MRVGVNGREMADENIPLVLDVLQRMVRHGMEPQLTSGLAEWLLRKGVTVEYTVLAPEREKPTPWRIVSPICWPKAQILTACYC